MMNIMRIQPASGCCAVHSRSIGADLALMFGRDFPRNQFKKASIRYIQIQEVLSHNVSQVISIKKRIFEVLH